MFSVSFPRVRFLLTIHSISKPAASRVHFAFFKNNCLVQRGTLSLSLSAREQMYVRTMTMAALRTILERLIRISSKRSANSLIVSNLLYVDSCESRRITTR